MAGTCLFRASFRANFQWMFVLLGVMAFASAAFSQQQTPPPQAPSATTQKPTTGEAVEKCTITGKVLSAGDGQALKKANVTLILQQPPSGGMVRPTTVTTDGNGVFRFTEIVAGRYAMSVTRNGYARQYFGERIPGGPGATISLIAGQNLRDIVVRLLPAAAISGKIVDEDGEAVAGVRVQLMRYMYMRGKRQLGPTGFGSTDDRGQFRIFGIAAGRYYISATYSGSDPFMSRSGSDASEAYAPTYYPGTNDVSQATPIVLRASDDQPGFNFRLLPGRAVRISGTVRLSSGEPGKNTFVQIWPRGQVLMMPNSFQSTDEKGNFTVPSVLPGSYVIVATDNSNADNREIGRVEIEVSSEPLENILVQLGSGSDLAANIHLEGDVDLSKNTVRLVLGFEDMMPMQTPLVELKEAGTATIKHVLDGNYRVSVSSLPDDAYVSRAEYDGKDILAEGLKVRGGTDALSITISATGAHIEGTVADKNKKPVSGAQVALVPEESKRLRQDLFRTATTDQYGHFVLRGIAPGTYKLFAWEAIDMGAYMDPDFLKIYEDQGKSVVLGTGEKISPELTVIPTTEKGT